MPRQAIGGEGGIRTLDTLLTYTHFPGVRLQPLGHLSQRPAEPKPVATSAQTKCRRRISGRNRLQPPGETPNTLND